MAKIIFIDDEQDILDHYKSAFAKRAKTSALESLALDLFDPSLVVGSEATDDLAGIEALTANQGLEAIDVIKRELATNSPVEIAFIDMRMPPGIDGKETAKRIRALDDKIEIVIVTAYSDTQPDQLLREIGKPDKLIYLKKPFDLSEIKQLIRNLTTKYKSERIKEEFIGNVTHELKTPLSAILGFSEILGHELTPETPHHEYVRILHANAGLMKALISDLIESVNTSRGEMVMLPERFDLSAQIRDCFLSFKAIPSTKDVELRLFGDTPNSFVRADPTRFKQVIFNLLTNAMKFTEKGTITLAIKDEGAHFLVVVEDTGEGISEENLGKVFEKFFRVENSHHSTPGLGLGLFLVKNILDLHHFKFRLESKLGVGTRFTIILPKEVP